MSLGLDQLTPDQFLELLQEVVAELANRDPFLRSLAQQSILSEAQKLEATRAAGNEALAELAQATAAALLDTAKEEATKAILSGELRLLPPSIEARIVAEGTLEARIALIDRVMEAITMGTALDPEDPSLPLSGVRIQRMRQAGEKQFREWEHFERNRQQQELLQHVWGAGVKLDPSIFGDLKVDLGLSNPPQSPPPDPNAPPAPPAGTPPKKPKP